MTDPTSASRLSTGRRCVICASESFDTAFPDADMLLLYHRSGLKVIEFPGHFKPRTSGNSMHSTLSAAHYVYKMTISMLVVALTPHKTDKVGP